MVINSEWKIKPFTIFVEREGPPVMTCRNHKHDKLPNTRTKRHFNGIDTCSITDYGNFDFNSKLSQKAESISLINRSDINAHLAQLVHKKVLSQYTANSLR